MFPQRICFYVFYSLKHITTTKFRHFSYILACGYGGGGKLPPPPPVQVAEDKTKPHLFNSSEISHPWFDFKEIVTLRVEPAPGETPGKKMTLTGCKAKVTQLHTLLDHLLIIPQA